MASPDLKTGAIIMTCGVTLLIAVIICIIILYIVQIIQEFNHHRRDSRCYLIVFQQQFYLLC